jgi:type I restriction-modification system DNA methylase subunit
MLLAESVDEWTFTGDVQSWVNEMIRKDPELPFSEAKIEVKGRGDLQRRDLTLFDRNGKPIFSGEIRLPDRPDGRTPYSQGLLENAHHKADSIGIPYFFTWNINRFVLWKTFEAGTPIIHRDYKYWDVTAIRDGSDLAHPRVRQQIKAFLQDLLTFYGAVVTDKEVVRSRPLDERFIHILESELEQPATLTLKVISNLYNRKLFKRQLDKWMRDTQGWLLSDDEEIIRENLDRAAKFTCYVLANRIVFHTALRRKFIKLPKLRVPASIKTGAELSAQLRKHFEEAKHFTHDYETVFDGDFGDGLPFLNDESVDGWRELVAQIEAFDFTKLDYDIIGHIFERLIGPEERHRYGQHYTKTEIVDLVNSFCIRDAEAHVLDPSCGGGTFLVRAYALKRFLAEVEPKHAELLEQIKGTDISAYPVHLSTLNLATRQLLDAQNYPLVARSDFFEVKPDRPIFHVPMGKAGGGGKQIAMLQVSKVDAVVGNPPYIRQEILGKAYKKKLATLIQSEFPGVVLSQRSDVYVYFFPHAAAFLRGPGSYLGLLTGIGWLDTDYGFRLQKFLLDNFRIVAVIESSREPWFTGARVATAVTILQREPDSDARLNNLVKFVQVRMPLKELFAEDSSSEDRLLRARALRDSIEETEENVTDERWRIRVLRQEELYRKGCWEPTDEIDDNFEDEVPDTEREAVEVPHAQIVAGEELPPYRGGKWGVYLRAPDIFFDLTDRFAASFVPLRDLAEIKFGLKTGADGFFFVEDTTDLALAEEPIDSRFRAHYGISRSQTNRVRIIKSGDNSAHTVEAEYLDPVIPSLMGIESVEIARERLNHSVLLVNGSEADLRNQHVLNYIQWGEDQALHQRPSCSSRNPWFDLTGAGRAPIILPKIQQYRHIVSWNEHRFICGSALLAVSPKNGVGDAALCALLNSTVCALMKHVYARQHGREGSIQLDVYAANMMIVPDIRQTEPGLLAALARSLDRLRARGSLDLDREFELPDRQELDDLVLQIIGLDNEEERISVRQALYEQIAEMYRAAREVEKEMQGFRRRMARRGKLTPASIAADVWESVDKADLRHFPRDFVPKRSVVETIQLAAATNVKLVNDLFEKGTLRTNGHTYALGHPDRALFAARVLQEGQTGEIGIPTDDEVCADSMSDHHRYRDAMEKDFKERAAEYSADEDWQERIVKQLWKLHRAIGLAANSQKQPHESASTRN